MSSEPLLQSSSRSHSFEMALNDDPKTIKDLEVVDDRLTVNTGFDSPPDDDLTAHSGEITSRKQRLSDLWTILCAGCGLISDGYANSLMTLINVVLRRQYAAQYTSTVSTRVSNSLLIGEIIGQISVGLTCDYIGRKTALVLTTSMIILGLVLSASANGYTIGGMFWMLTIARGITGFGTGGEYPASSTSASEAANGYNLRRRGRTFILVTNLPLTFGVPLASSIFLIVLQATGNQLQHPSALWRICFGIGVIFPLTVFYWRVKMVNSALYRRGAMRKSVPYWLVLKYYWRSLIGTCGTWFLYDFVTIPNAVFSGGIINSIVASNDIQGTAEWQLLLGAIALPGVLIGAFMCDILRRKTIMMIGFGGYLVFGLIIGCAYTQISAILPLFVVFYGIMLSFGNFGPGNMLGIISTESYSTGVRGTCYGLSAAVGKAGAAVGTQVFLPIENNLSVRWTFIIAAIVGCVGIGVTQLFVRDLSGDDLKWEDERFRAYLVAKGWRGMMGEEDLKESVEQGIPVGVREEVIGGGRGRGDVGE